MYNDRNLGMAHETNGLLAEWVSIEKITDLSRYNNEQIVLDYYTLLLFVKGKGEFSINGSPAKIANNAIYLLPPNSKLEEGHATGRGDLEAYQLQFDLYRAVETTPLRRVYEREPAFPVEGWIAENARSIRRLVLLMAEHEDPVAGRKRRAHRQQLLVKLLDLLLESRAGTEQEVSLDDRLQLTIAYLTRHYRQDVKMEKLAEMADMQSSYFSQRFKQKMNKTPIEFLTELRMNKAKQLLLASDGRSIREVARETGYRDEYYFSRRFKEQVGCAPSFYVKRQSTPGIVCLSYPYNYHLKTLGITPLAVQPPNPFSEETATLILPYHEAEAWDVSRKNFLRQKPDILLCKDNVSQKAWEHLGDIGPIVTVPWKNNDVVGHLTQIARIVNRMDRARAWVDHHELKAREGRKEVKRKIGEGTVALCSMTEQGIRIYGARNIGHVFYRSLQLAPPPRIKAELDKHPPGTGFTWLSITEDELSDYEADFIFFVIKNRTEIHDISTRLKNNPLWTKYPAVRNRRYNFLLRDKWIIYAPGALDEQFAEAVGILRS